MKDCIFCKIARKESPATIVFETADTLAFTPLEIVSRGHTLLIPKKHFENIFAIDEKIFKDISVSAKQLSLILKDQYQATGINILHASGKDAQQSVFHFHIHLIPRYHNDGLDLWIKNKL